MATKKQRSLKVTDNMFSSTWGLPPQSVPTAIKETKAWKQSNLDFFDAESQNQMREKLDDVRKFNILSGQFAIKDYSYTKDPISMLNEQSQQAMATNTALDSFNVTEDIQHFPIMVRPINTIIGEYISRIPQLHGFYVKNESDYARNEYNRQKTEMLREWATQQVMRSVMQKVKASGAKPNTPDYQTAIQQNTPEEIQDYMDRDYTDVVEGVCQTLLKSIWKAESLDSEFVEGFKSACVVAKEFYHIYSVNGRTKVKNIPSTDVFYHKSPSYTWVSEGQYAGFRQYLTPSAVIDLFYDDLSYDDIKEIERSIFPNTASSKTATANVSYDTKSYSNSFGDPNIHDTYNMISDFQRYGESYNFNNRGLIKVVRAYWKSTRKVGWLSYIDQQTGEDQLEMVDDSYVPKTEQGESIEYTPHNQVYTGVKILDNIYIGVKPYQDQIIDLDDLCYAPLPIEGCCYNDTHSKPYSLVDLMTPWNELYNIGAHELKQTLNSNIGKVLFMSIDHMPNIPGFTMKKWYYWARKFKIAWVKQPKTGPNNFNQFTAADMSAIQAIQSTMDMLERIKQECDAIAGFSPGRVAAQSKEATLGQSTQQLTASVNQTEYLFFKHSKLIERVLNQALNIGRKGLKDKVFLRNLFDDYQQAFIDFDQEQVSNARIGLYVTNNSGDQQKRAAMQSLMQAAVQNGADFADLSEVIMAETITEVRQLGNKLRRNAKAMNDFKNQFEQKKLETETNLKTRELDDKLTMARERNEASVEASYIRTFGGMNASPHDDYNEDGQPDILEFANLSLKTQDMMKKHQFKERELNFKEKQHSDTVRMDEKQLQAEKERTRIMANKKKTTSS